MALRFRKSFKIAPGLKINLSKSGIGMSAGVKGARIGVNSRGAYTSAGIPGSGIYSMSYLGKKSNGTTSTVSHINSRTIKTSTRTDLIWLIPTCVIIFAINWIAGVVVVTIATIWYQIFVKARPSYKAKMKLKSAKYAYKKGDYAHAADGFSFAYSVFTDDKAIALLAASSYSQINQLDEAISYMSEYLSAFPGDTKMSNAQQLWKEKTDCVTKQSD